MATAAAPRVSSEQRVILHDVSWRTYESLLDDRGERPAPRYAYDRGVLEILSPLTAEHERTNQTLALIVDVLAEEWSIDCVGVGGLTLRREVSKQGLEPDSSFYIAHEAQMRGATRFDPDIDPPPDLAIEIDVTNASIDKFPIYAGLGVPEVWRCAMGRVTIHVREGEGYRAVPVSTALPPVTGEVLTRFVAESRTMGSTAWLRMVREWAREQAVSGNPLK